MRTKTALSIALLCAPPALAQNPPIDLTRWTTEHLNGTGPWVLDAPRLNCHATNQAITDCAVLYSDFQMPTDLEFRMWIDPDGGDDDLCGFAIGWNPGDASNPNADYLLVDWKRTTQSFQDWGSAVAGLAVSRVVGPFTRGYGGAPKDLWSHTGVCTELARGSVHGSQGWSFATNYHFRVLFTGGNLTIWVNGVPEFSLSGSFNTSGRFACYQFSQPLTSFQFPTAGSFTEFGAGCRGSAGTPYLFSPSTPFLGQELPIIVANLARNAVPFLFVGASSSTWRGIPLPFDLTTLGAPGCSLYASGEILLPVANFSGTGYLALPIPGSLFAGTRFHTQSMVVDPTANSLGLVFSNAASGTVGVR
jgi:hypothetical protein